MLSQLCVQLIGWQDLYVFPGTWWNEDTVLMSLSFEKLLSPDATVTGIVSQMRSLIDVLGKTSHSLFLCKYCNSSRGVYFLPKEADFLMHQALLLA